MHKTQKQRRIIRLPDDELTGSDSLILIVVYPTGDRPACGRKSHFQPCDREGNKAVDGMFSSTALPVGFRRKPTFVYHPQDAPGYSLNTFI